MACIVAGCPSASAPTIRRGTPADLRAVPRPAVDLGHRPRAPARDPLEGDADAWWEGIESVHRFLAEHAAEWWVAEAPDGGELIGYARSIERGGLFELTELFVRPGLQSKGIGRQLLEHAFPLGSRRRPLDHRDNRRARHRPLLRRRHGRAIPVLHPHGPAALGRANGRHTVEPITTDRPPSRR